MQHPALHQRKIHNPYEKQHEEKSEEHEPGEENANSLNPSLARVGYWKQNYLNQNKLTKIESRSMPINDPFD